MGNLAERAAGSNLVGLPDVMVQAGTHLATYFSSEAGRVRIAAPFLREGIVLGQPCFLIASGKILERYIKALEKDVKKELAEARRRGLFATAPTPGRTLEEALAFWDEQIAAAMSAFSPTIVRIVGDMACVKGSFADVHQMLIFERQLGAILKSSPTVSLCQYDVREFDGPTLLEAIKAPKELIGERALVGHPSGRFVQVIVESTLTKLDVDVFRELAATEVEVAAAIAKHLSMRLRAAHKLLGVRSLGSIRERVAYDLLDRASQSQLVVGRLEVRATQADLADSIGSWREVVSRALTTLRAKGIVETAPGVVRILAPSLLASIVGAFVT